MPGTTGTSATAKVPAVIAGTMAGDGLDRALDVLRHGGIARIFTGGRAATTTGTHVRPDGSLSLTGYLLRSRAAYGHT